MIPIDVVIPVGPFENDKRWLIKCLDSVATQMHRPANVILIDDMADLNPLLPVIDDVLEEIPFSIFHNPWRLGCSDSWNIGVAQAESEHVFLMGADDWLDDRCLGMCADTYRAHPDPLGYYYVEIRYQPDGEEQNLPCNAAMVSKTLWKRTGGFPVEAGLGAPDAAFLSILHGAQGAAGNIIRVGGGVHYNVRRHEAQETGRQNLYFAEIQSVRDKLTSSWKPPTWTRSVEPVNV